MARWHSCNVLQVGAQAQHVWQFDARSGTFAMTREQVLRPGEPPPPRLVAKTWSSLWQKKLNVAWLPPENVFIRVARFPLTSPEETRAMVEFQLEKLSPIPITQAVWSLQVLSSSAAEPRRSESEPVAGTESKSGPMQTVAVVIVERKVVEEFLGKLEGEGYQADRLELPLLDQLQASTITAEGAWIYPQSEGGKDTALVAWCYGGVLHNVDLITLPPPAERAAGLKDQLMQMAWAGELEGWMTSPPRWHLVADDATAAEWMEPLRAGLEQLIEVIPPLPGQELAARTARRAVEADPNINNLLPPEFGTRYHQQFVDRLWLRGLGALLALYALGLIVYFVALGFLNYQTKAAETKVSNIAPAFTNAVQLKLQYQILKDRQELKYAALDCWEAVAETLPENITLNSMNFSGDAKKITLTGTAPSGEFNSVMAFSEKLRRSTTPPPKSTPLFNLHSMDQPSIQIANNIANWTYVLELKRTETP